MNLRDRIINFQVHYLGLPLVKRIVPAEIIPYSMEELRLFPKDTLGNDLFHFLTRHHFTFLPHFETHDVKHVLLNYSATGKDEASMQFFYLGNRHYSLATITSAIASFIFMPDYFLAFRKAFKRGRKSLPIGKIYLGDLLFCNTKELQAHFQIETISQINKNN